MWQQVALRRRFFACFTISQRPSNGGPCKDLAVMSGNRSPILRTALFCFSVPKQPHVGYREWNRSRPLPLRRSVTGTYCISPQRDLMQIRRTSRFA